jgi:hypothetical protein
MLLSNTPPFHGATEDELIERIFEAKVTFTDPTWAGISPEAKALIKKLLTVSGCCLYTWCSHRWLVHGLMERRQSFNSRTQSQGSLRLRCSLIRGSSHVTVQSHRRCKSRGN